MDKQIIDKKIVDTLYEEGLLYSAYGMYERRVHGESDRTMA